MGESEKEVKKFEMDWGENLTKLDKGLWFQAIFNAESPETLQDASVFVLALVFQAQ